MFRGDGQNVPSYTGGDEPAGTCCLSPRRFCGKRLGAAADTGANQRDPPIVPRRLPDLLRKCPRGRLRSTRMSQRERGNSLPGVPTRCGRGRRPRCAGARARFADRADGFARRAGSGRPNDGAASRGVFGAPRLRFRLPDLLQLGATWGRSHHRMPARKRPVIIGPVPFRLGFGPARQVAEAVLFLSPWVG